MSIKIMSQCWDIEILTSTQKLVLLSLADQANDDGVCWPSAATTAKRTGLFDRSVRRTIAELEALGFLSRKFQTGKPTFYQLNPCPTDTPVAKTPVRKTRPPLSHRPQPLSEESMTPVTGVNITVSNHQEPSVEPKDLVVAKATTKGTRLPVDWALPKELGNWALEQGLNKQQVILEGEKFRDHWIAQAGAKGRKADWPATWRNWVRNSKTRQPQTFYQITKEQKERDADKRLTAIGNATMAELEEAGLARNGVILGGSTNG